MIFAEKTNYCANQDDNDWANCEANHKGKIRLTRACGAGVNEVTR
jgi:hypothetical protein